MKIVGNYYLIEVLGRGHDSKVYRAVNQTKGKLFFAVKQITKKRSIWNESMKKSIN